MSEHLPAMNKADSVLKLFEAHKAQVAAALPKHMDADRMIRIALTTFRRTPKLLDCDPKTLFGAVISCAQLGLEPDGYRGEAYLLPYENRKLGTVDVQLIVVVFKLLLN